MTTRFHPPILPRVRLAVRGDDMGAALSANQAIAQAVQAGVLLNVSVMVPGPVFEQAAELLRGLPGVCIGLHVTLNSEFAYPCWGPVLPRHQAPSLVNAAGYFFPTPQELLDHGVDPDHALLEVRAQLTRARSAGLTISYLDEHMGVGWIKGLRDRLHTLAATEGLLYADDIPPIQLSSYDVVVQPPVDKMCQDLLAALREQPSGTYRLITHPAFDDAEMRAICLPGGAPDEIILQRDADRRLLCAPNLREMLQAEGVQLLRFSELTGEPTGDTL